MNKGPKSLTSQRGYVARLGPRVGDFPKLTELYSFPAAGEYYLELRLWKWVNEDRHFKLSDPIRLKVIFDGNRN